MAFTLASEQAMSRSPLFKCLYNGDLTMVYRELVIKQIGVSFINDGWLLINKWGYPIFFGL
jgi:hypothetical protein